MVLPKRQIIHTREGLLRWVMDHAPSPTVRRCFDEGQVRNLGAYDPISPYSNPGWIVELITRFNRLIYIAVMVKELSYVTLDVTAEHDQWCKNYKGGEHPLYKGDV